MMKPKVDMVIDLQYGSTGKGLISGYLAYKNEYDTAISANMPNAGHTFIDDQGRKFINKVLPNAAACPSVRTALIGPGAVFDIDQLVKEVRQHLTVNPRLFVGIHQNAAVLGDRHKQEEAQTLSGISSTMQGSMAATVEKMRRTPRGNITAKQIKWQFYDRMRDENLVDKILILDNKYYNEILDGAKNVLAEGAQGYSLSLNGPFYPYCTSRDCTPTRFMSDMQIPHTMLRRVIGTARLHPIRVGNTEDGYSGDFYVDQEETTWEELGVPEELTTVTKRVRRVFTFSGYQMKESIYMCQPNEVFLNFCNYAPDLVPKTITIIEGYMNELANGGSVRYTGWGPTIKDVRERNFLNPCDYTREEHVRGLA
jgi:adenylosuccinate synthase